MAALLPGAVSDLAARHVGPLPDAALDARDTARRARADVYLTHAEAAEHLRISKRTLDTLTQSGEVVPARIGRKRLYAVAALDAYVRVRTRPPWARAA